MRVIVVGSIAPSTYLARGVQQGPVELTDELRKLIRNGYVDVVEYIDDAPSKSEDKPKTTPRKRASTAADEDRLSGENKSSDG